MYLQFWLYTFIVKKYFFLSGDDELHPIQYYPETPSKSDDKLISSLISRETGVLEDSTMAASVEASANSLSDSLLHILDWLKQIWILFFWTKEHYMWTYAYIIGKKSINRWCELNLHISSCIGSFSFEKRTFKKIR